jgi:hypothetical protein
MPAPAATPSLSGCPSHWLGLCEIAQLQGAIAHAVVDRV